MKIEFKHGPKDGERKFLPMGRHSETILVDMNGKDYLYRKTERVTVDGLIIYQCVVAVAELAAA